jgi:sigma-B regulation protein RsbU (phosphoserine phosphatase)
MKEMNHEFYEILTSLPNAFFASAFYFVADTTSRIATYACAGHPPPFQVHRDRARVSRLAIPQPKGAALGLIGHESYPGETVRLLDGHSFIFFTDGVYECANPEGEEYGLARMEKVIQANIYKSTPEILDALIQSINTFVKSEPLADDLCLVAVDVTSAPRPT